MSVTCNRVTLLGTVVITLAALRLAIAPRNTNRDVQSYWRQREHRDAPPPPQPDQAHSAIDHSARRMSTNWSITRLQKGKPLRLVAAGLSRSGSTYQFNLLRLLLVHAVERHVPGGSAKMVHSAHGHRIEDLQECLAKRYCVVKVHEFSPDVLLRVHAVFLTHRDPRDALLSSAQRLSSCLIYGSQPLLPAFIAYATWKPHACFDMQYETMVREGDYGTARRHMLALGLRAGSRATAFVATQLGEIMRGTAVSGGQSGLMRGHINQLSTAPGAHRTMRRHLPALSSFCNLSLELGLIETGWGGYLKAHGYEATSDPRFSTNALVDSLPQAAVLMAADGPPARCPHTSNFDAVLAASGVWRYSLLREKIVTADGWSVRHIRAFEG